VSERATKVLFAVVVITLPVVVLALFEGAASLLLVADTVMRQTVSEDAHAEPDTLLGWVNRPDVSRPDLYGPGIGLRTNAQRFRHVGPVSPRAADGTRRVICSGDSFTLGYGVADGQTWCDRLGQAARGLETVNMGQGGYGIDQAYLWYLRDGIGLHPDVHVFAMVTADFQRMQQDRFIGFPKPILVRVGDSVRASGVPVPRAGMARRIILLTTAVREMRLFQLFSLASRPRAETSAVRDSSTWETARAAFRHLARRDSAAGAAFVVVLLPTVRDYQGSESDRWRRWLNQAAARGEFTFVDLVEALRRVPPDSEQALFIPAGELRFYGAGRHLSVAGNQWVADLLARRVSVLGSAAGQSGPTAP